MITSLKQKVLRHFPVSTQQINEILIKFLSKYQFVKMKQHIKNKRINILDIGCANHSPTMTKIFFPKSHYYGIDIEPCVDINDLRNMDKFYQINLETETYKLNSLPNNFFDIIIMSHIIEHLSNGEVILSHLFPKLISGGFLYLEFPSYRSTKFKSKIIKGTYNFYDDPTHIRIYFLNKLIKFLINNDFIIIEAGIRRFLRRIVLFPIALILDIIRFRKITAGIFWDIKGFAEFILAKKQ